MASRKVPLLTPEEYLRIEREAPFKSEYIDGVMYPVGEMPIAADNVKIHNAIVANIATELRSRLDAPNRDFYQREGRLLTTSGAPFAHHYTRQADNQWLLSDIIGIDSTLTIDSIGRTLPLTEICDRVSFDKDEPRGD